MYSRPDRVIKKAVDDLLQNLDNLKNANSEV